jgi:hypothetical protein
MSEKMMTPDEALEVLGDSCRALVAYGHPALSQEVHAARATLSQQLQAQAAEVSKYKAAWEEYDKRTQWVQDTAKPRELGMHRADVLRHRIEAAEGDAKRLREGMATIRAQMAEYASRTLAAAQCESEEGDAHAINGWCAALDVLAQDGGA